MRHDILDAAIAWVEAQKDPQGSIKGYVLSILGKRRRAPRKPKWQAALMPVPALKKELDRVFSLYIRQRDSDPDTGIGRCITCGHAGHWKTMDCGHYCPRQDINTRWDEKNCALQCGACNGFRGGEAEKFAQAIDLRHGVGTAELLRAKSRMPLKLDRHRLSLWIKDIKAKIGE